VPVAVRFLERRRVIPARAIFLLVLAARPLAAQVGPAARLQAARPEFADARLQDAVAAGDAGARLAAVSEPLQRLGFQAGDVVLAVNGVRLSGAADAAGFGSEAAAVFTVWRGVDGPRPVLASDAIGRQVVDEFVGLPAGERTPMRLALMLANQATLVQEGAGVLLVPRPATPDEDAVWLRLANPLPPASEQAQRAVGQAVLSAARLPPLTTSELDAAEAALASGRFDEAEARARRALLLHAGEPENRSERQPTERAVQVLIEARRGARAHRTLLLAVDPRFGIVIEGHLNHIQRLLMQDTLVDLGASRGGAFAGGVRLRLPWLPPLSLLLEYGQLRNDFQGSFGEARLEATVHQVSAELLYRPRVASRLRPFLRAGAGLFATRAAIGCIGSPAVAVEATDPGALVGGGLDVLRLASHGIRISATGTYRILHHGLDAFAPTACEDATRLVHPDFVASTRSPFLDFDGWQLGLMLALER
jgi:hypothetical protein